MKRTHLTLLRSDDPQSGIVSRADVRELNRIMFAIMDTNPDEAKALWAVALRIRSTIPSWAWDNDLDFPTADPSLGLEPIL